MKKVFLGLGATALTVSLAACSGGASDVNTDAYDYADEIENATFNTETVAEVSFWHTMGDANQQILNGFITEFNKTYPNVKISHYAQGGYEDINSNLKNAISAKEAPTMAFAYPDHVADYLGNDYGASQVFPLSALLTDDVADDYIKSYLDEGLSYGGEHYFSMPFSKSTEALFYNKTLFDENGWTVPTTWDEFETLAAKIKTAEPDMTVLGYDSDDNLFITTAAQYGYDYTSATGDNYIFNNEGNVALVEKYKTWHNNGWLTTKGLSEGAYTSTQFTTGSLAMTIGSTGGVKYNIQGSDFEVGVAAIPQANTDSTKDKVISQGPSICFFKNSDINTVLAAWEFYRFCTNDENSATYALATGYNPVTNGSYETESYKELFAKTDFGTSEDEKISKAIKEVALISQDYSKNNSFEISPAFRGSAAARQEVGFIITYYLSGKYTTAKDAFDNAIATLSFK